MIQSMTGFGKATTAFLNKKISVEIKSLNSKQLDLSTRVPNAYREKEIEIRSLVAQTVERGKVDVSIFVDNGDSNTVYKINQEMIVSYQQQILETAKNLNLPLPEDWFRTLLKLPDAIKTETTELDDVEWVALKETINAALEAFVEFRIQEGRMLGNVFLSKIDAIDQLLYSVEQYDTDRVERVKGRLIDSLAKLGVNGYDENRFEQELIYYIERLDVNEEKSRLSNHLHYFIETMETETCQGRKLGFIVQEMGREINTLGSKSNHAEMQKIVVQMKDELEQMKEQIFNVL
ncbi:hypothetical protein FACS1894162_7420 [Bacteroidia bacterium]|nr:hypothetical protein FACS1894162_7420 [Bacteroidia bacterium]